jgi:hypothetical protein
MKSDFYFTTHATESEHSFIADLLVHECHKFRVSLAYYRKFKNGHVPMFREGKIMARPVIAKRILSNINLNYENANQKVTVDKRKVPIWQLENWIRYAIAWRREHAKHVEQLEEGCEACFEPCNADKWSPELWKAGSWVWLRRNYKL